jgi:hypothetical protein
VVVLEPAAYGGSKDASAARAAVGAVDAEGDEVPEALQELWTKRTAILTSDGHLPCAEAERVA